jgi:CDP-diacylglycerol--serine O-phosphatidyltransferase
VQRTAPGIRFLPNAITVLAVCSGLSAVMFALDGGKFQLAALSVSVAAVLDGLDGRIARLLDATSKMGAELDSLCDGISFGVAPALVIYVWELHEYRAGWIVCLVFAVCMVLRLARFNTLLEDTEQPPFTKEFFVGVPAPAGGLLLFAPMLLQIQFGDGWWSSLLVTSVWTIGISALLISRIPTLSVKTVRVSPRYMALLLVGVALLAAAVVTWPLGSLVAVMLIYLIHIPYAVRRYNWLAKHPEAWSVPLKERRAIRRNPRRLGIRPPLRRRVAGAARRAVGRSDDRINGAHVDGPRQAHTHPRGRDWRRISLRRR